MAAVVLPLAALFRRAEPGRRRPRRATGAVPNADRRRRSGRLAGAGWTLGEAMRTPHFWLLFSVYLFTGLGSFFVSLHQLAFAVDIGFDKLYAAEVLGMGAFLAVPGIVVTGTLSDYLGREIVGDPGLWDLDPRRRLRPVHHQPRPAPAAMAARLLFRPDLGGARPGDHRQDRRSVSRGRSSARSSASSRSAAASARRSAPGARAGSTICPAATASPSSCRSPPMPADGRVLGVAPPAGAPPPGATTAATRLARTTRRPVGGRVRCFREPAAGRAGRRGPVAAPALCAPPCRVRGWNRCSACRDARR